MKTSALLLLIGSVCLAQAIESTAWQWVQPFAIDKPGIVRLDLSPAVINASRPLLEDIRLLSPAGSETPFVIENVLLTPPRELSAENPHFSLGDQTSTFEMETGTTDPIEAVVFGVSSGEFLKAVRLEASNDGVRWKVLAANDVLFRQSIGASRLRIPFASGSWKRLRLILDDHETKRVILTSARFEISSQRPVTTPGKAMLVQTEELPGETRYTIDLGAANLHMASLKLNVTDPVLSRKVRAFYTKAHNGVQTEVQLATSIFYRVSTGNGVTAESMDIPIHQHVPSSKITLVVENRGSPPLHPTDVTIERHPQALLFFAQESGAWRLITGNPQAKAPSYDVSALQKEVGHATTVSLTPGSLAASTGYQSPPALPDIAPEGAVLDVTGWHYRKALTTGGAGIFRMELDTEVLAHTPSQLGDLRIVQNGKQIPFILDRTNQTRVMAAEVTPVHDEKRPTVSIWRVRPALQGVPMTRLSFASPTPLFDRLIKVWHLTTDSSGHESRVSLGSGPWTHTSSSPKTDFVLNLNHSRAPAEFFIETDNSDNPPISIETVQLAHPVVTLVTKLIDPAPSFLYYGNDHASEPRYDLRMIKTEMLSASSLSATIGPEETLNASADYHAQRALPDIAPEGALLDVSNWHYRKVLSLSGVGVFHVELDAETLAHAQSLLGDLRIVQAGKQLPFILERTNLTRGMTPEVTAEPDEKRPSVSVWHVKPSLQGVPIMKLSFTSPTPLFERTIKIWRLQKEQSGRELRVSLGSDLWAHSSPAFRPDFIINLNNLRAPEDFYIETDNGDNPPISIENVQLHHQVVSLVTKFTDASPAFLYYGNDKVFEPRYDLRMVKKEMLSAPHRPLAMGPEEVLKAAIKKRPTDVGADSPWLWVALATMVIGLLWVVARMLPKTGGTP